MLYVSIQFVKWVNAIKFVKWVNVIKFVKWVNAVKFVKWVNVYCKDIKCTLYILHCTI